MGKRGKIKQPIEIMEMKGTLRPDREIDHMKPTAVTGLVPPPHGVDFDEHAKQVWMRTIDLLVRYRVLTDSDLEALAVYCTAVSRFWQAQRDISERGQVLEVVTTTGVVSRRNPSVDIASQQYVIMKDLQSRFGLTPSDRRSVPVVADQGKEEEW